MNGLTNVKAQMASRGGRNEEKAVGCRSSRARAGKDSVTSGQALAERAKRRGVDVWEGRILGAR